MKGGRAAVLLLVGVIDAEHPLRPRWSDSGPGDRVKLTFIGDGNEQTVDVTLGQPQ